MAVKTTLRHYRRLAAIQLNLYWKLARLHFAGRLTKIAFAISPDFEKEMRRSFGYARFAREYLTAEEINEG